MNKDSLYLQILAFDHFLTCIGRYFFNYPEKEIRFIKEINMCDIEYSILQESWGLFWNPVMMLCELFLILLIPYENGDHSLDNIIKNFLYYKDVNIDYCRHLRNSLAHQKYTLYQKNWINYIKFDDYNNVKKTATLIFQCKDMGLLIHQLLYHLTNVIDVDHLAKEIALKGYNS